MNNTTKIALLVGAALLIYYYFFRSIVKPTTTNSGRPITDLAGEIRDGVNTITDRSTPATISTIGSRTPVSSADARSSAGQDNSFNIASTSYSVVLRG
jgi:hypothetical protein